jgi:hypothetical protein
MTATVACSDYSFTEFGASEVTRLSSIVPSITSGAAMAVAAATLMISTITGIPSAEAHRPNGADQMRTIAAMTSPWRQQAAQHSATYRALAMKIRSFQDLPENWDRDEGVAPQPETISNAIAFLGEAAEYGSPPRVFVVGDGEVGLAWEAPDGYVQIGFHDNGEIVVIGRSADGLLDIRGEFASLPHLPRLVLRQIIQSL